MGGGGALRGGVGVGVVVCEGRESWAPAGRRDQSVFTLTSVWLPRLVQRQRRRRRSLVARRPFRWRRAGWFNSSSVSLCRVGVLRPSEQASGSPNPPIVLIRPDLIYQRFRA